MMHFEDCSECCETAAHPLWGNQLNSPSVVRSFSALNSHRTVGYDHFHSVDSFQLSCSLVNHNQLDALSFDFPSDFMAALGFWPTVLLLKLAARSASHVPFWQSVVLCTSYVSSLWLSGIFPPKELSVLRLFVAGYCRTMSGLRYGQHLGSSSSSSDSHPLC